MPLLSTPPITTMSLVLPNLSTMYAIVRLPFRRWPRAISAFLGRRSMSLLASSWLTFRGAGAADACSAAAMGVGSADVRRVARNTAEQTASLRLDACDWEVGGRLTAESVASQRIPRE
jgi:hypothetical protein